MSSMSFVVLGRAVAVRELPAILTPERLSALLAMTPHGVRGLIRRGELPAFRLGRRWFVRRDAFEAFIRRGERERPTRLGTAEEVARILRHLPPPRRQSKAI